MNAAKHYQVDHIDGNPLNNQKYNLRLCTNQENSCNKRIRKSNQIGYKGVFLVRKNQKYSAVIGCNYKTTRLGTFSNKETAAFMYNIAAKSFHGVYANLNKIVNKDLINYYEIDFYLNKKGGRLSLLLNFPPFVVYSALRT